MIVVYRYRVKSSKGLLNKQARAANFVWNFCNETQKHALRWRKRWPTGFDLNTLTTGSSKELGLHSGTVNAVCEQYAKSRARCKRSLLRWRGRRSLRWVPLKGRAIKETANGFHFHGREFRVFKSRSLPVGATIKDGTNFARDARGNWFLNVCIEIADVAARPIQTGVGIDLGLKDLATLSNGEVIANPCHAAKHARRLAVAQRAGKKRQAVNLHARIANARRDHLHKVSLDIVRRFDYIAVGDVNAKGLAKTSMAKSVNDVSWTTFRNMLRYKAITHGAKCEEVSERFTTQTCSCCGSISPSSPKGRVGLGIRQWMCSDCGTLHNRDVNAALNILARSGHRALAVGIPAF